MRDIAITLFIILALATISCKGASPEMEPPVSAEITILSSCGWQSGRYVNIVGEIRNDAMKNVCKIIISATFYNEQGGVICTREGRSTVPVLAPTETSPFRVTAYPTIIDWPCAYDLKITYDTTNTPSALLQHSHVFVDKLRYTGDGKPWISGDVSSPSTMQQTVTVIVILRDVDGCIMDFGSTAMTLRSGGHHCFELVTSRPIRPDSYTVQVARP